MINYINLLVSVVHPRCGVSNMTISRYAVGISLDDRRMLGFNIDHWAKPENRELLLSLLCEDWLSDGCAVVGCEAIAGAVQWEGH